MTGYEADYETRLVEAGTQSRQVFRLYRDARGRTRMEGRADSLRFAFLTDYARRRAIVIDLETGKPVRQDGGFTKIPNSGMCEFRVPTDSRIEDLGETQMEGLTARGLRTTSGSTTVEVWTAPEIDQPPLLVRWVGPREEKTERLYNIRLGDPDPKLFAPLDAD